MSPQHEDVPSCWRPGQLELGHLEEERVRVLARTDELKSRLLELEQQLQESKQEVGRRSRAPAAPAPPTGARGWGAQLCLPQAEMERALLQGERQAELEQMEAETDVIAQLQHKLDELESAIQREKDKVG